MKYKSIFFLYLGLSVSLLLAAFKLWGPEEILSSSPWQRVETWDDFDEDGTFVLDTIECKEDNHWLFLADGKFMITEHTLQCEPDMPFLDTIRGEWKLLNNDRQLRLSFADGEEGFSMNIEAIEENEVIFHFSGNEDPNDAVVRQRIILYR